MPALLALSIRQPWAWAIIHAGKDLENRKTLFSHRGLTLIHASAGMTFDEYDDAGHFMNEIGVLDVPPLTSLERGGIIGAVEIVDSVKESDSPWWMGPRALVLRNPRPIPFIPCRGTVAPLFWTPTPSVLAEATAALRA